MQKFRNVLYVVNALNFNCSGLSQAVRWAKQNQGSCIVKVVYPDYPNYQNRLPPVFIQQIEKDLLNRVRNYLDEHSIDKATVKVDIISAPKPALAIIRESIDLDVDLLIKAADDDSAGFRAFDNTIMRNASCPLFLVRKEPTNEDSIAVALDADPTSEEERELAIKLLKTAYSMATETSSRLHIIACWQFIFEDFVSSSTWSYFSDAEQIQLLRKYENDHFEQLKALINESGIQQDSCVIHHKRGAPENMIPVVMNNNEIDTLVVGSLSRTGFLGMVIGNTAENLLQKLTRSVLTFKPDNFCSPLENGP